MTKSLDDQIEHLKHQRAAIDLRLSRLSARKSSAERKADTRRKIIAGALALTHAEKNPQWGSVLLGLIEEYTVKAADRALFNLPPKPAPDEADRKEGDG